jgi:hypothetical protein
MPEHSTNHCKLRYRECWLNALPTAFDNSIEMVPCISQDCEGWPNLFLSLLELIGTDLRLMRDIDIQLFPMLICPSCMAKAIPWQTMVHQRIDVLPTFSSFL